MKQFVIIQGELAIAVTNYTETGTEVIIEAADISKVLSAPRGVYLQPERIKFVGSYTIIEQRKRDLNRDEH